MYFNVIDVIAILNEQDDYSKNRNYWKYLKTKLRKENSQLVSLTNQLKLTAADGKKYMTDTLDSNGVIELSKNFPNNRASAFLDWFLYSDKINDRETFMKGIDYSYYYEEE